jgi:hypothetical protein
MNICEEKEDKQVVLFDQLNSLLELGINCDSNYYTTKYWRTYLFALKDLVAQLETETLG